MYSLYMGLVLFVQEPCSNSTKALYNLYKAFVLFLLRPFRLLAAVYL